MQKGDKMAKPVVNQNKKKIKLQASFTINSLIFDNLCNELLEFLFNLNNFTSFLNINQYLPERAILRMDEIYKALHACPLFNTLDKSNFQGWFLCAGTCMSTIQYLRQAQDLKTLCGQCRYNLNSLP